MPIKVACLFCYDSSVSVTDDVIDVTDTEVRLDAGQSVDLAIDYTSEIAHPMIATENAAIRITNFDSGTNSCTCTVTKKYLPPIAITEPFAVESEEEMLALNCQKGDVAIRSDESKSYILKSAPASNKSNWLELQTPDCKINSVNGQIGTVVLTTADIEEKDNLYYTEDRAMVLCDKRDENKGGVS